MKNPRLGWAALGMAISLQLFVAGYAVLWASGLLDDPKPKAEQAPNIVGADDAPRPPLSGVVYQIHAFVPGAAGGVLDISVENGAGKQTHAQLRIWDPAAQITWNAAPVTPWELLGNLATFRCNVIYWPLSELNGAALRADFTGM